MQKNIIFYIYMVENNLSNYILNIVLPSFTCMRIYLNIFDQYYLI